MPQDRFLIAPLFEGSQSNLKPWLISDKAYALLRNVYPWRGSVRKRFGTRYMNESKSAVQQPLFSRLRINIGTTDAVTGNFSATVPGAIFKVGQQFSIGDTVFTVFQTGTPAAMKTTGTATGTYNTTTGAVVITGNNENPSTAIFFYPSEPVMELATYAVNAVNDETLIAFDTQFAYQFTYAGGWVRAGTAVWTPGANRSLDNFYWTTNYRAAGAQTWVMFVTNNVQADGFRYWNGAAWTTLGTFATSPIDGTAKFLQTCGSMIQFKGRLIAADVTIGDNTPGPSIRYPNMVLFSKEGDPTATDSWRIDTPGKGNYLIAPVQEAIIGMQYLKDQLIVQFESSTWQIVFTGNQLEPFRFQQINTELGVESPNSIVPFDRYVFGVGANGIHACNGLNVERVDELIPYTVFDISNTNKGPQRVYGIRDYYLEVVYWSYPSADIQDNNSNVFPNRVIVFDYIRQTWAYNDDSITALGNYQFDFSFTWAEMDATWEQTQTPWADPSLTSRFKSVLGGNQEGYTFIVDYDRSTNARVLSITNISVAGNIVTITSVEHNLLNGSYVYIMGILQTGGNLTDINDTIYKITVTGRDTFTISKAGLSGTYLGGGTIARVSELQILTKQYNFYNEVGYELATQQIDFYVDRTDSGKIQIDFYVSASNMGLLEDAQATGTLVGTSTLETSAYALVPLEASQSRFWHAVFFNAQGENLQLNMYLNDEQMRDKDIAFSDFQLNAMLFHTQRTSQFSSI